MMRPVILTAMMGRPDQNWANKLRQEYFPPERNFVDAHITLFHHLPPMHLPEIRSALSTMASEYPRPNAVIDRILNLGEGVAFHIHSPDLMEMREKLADQFYGLLIPQDQARPRLHITIQNKVTAKEAKALYTKLATNFEPRLLEITGLSAHYYMDGPWQHIVDYKFRGK